MGLFLIVVVVLVILFLRKRKPAQPQNAGRTPPAGQAPAALPPMRALPLRGRAVTEADLPKRRDALVQASDMPYQGKDSVSNPDYGFACTKKLLSLIPAKPGDISISIGTNDRAYIYIKYGVRLAEYYRDGHGCDPDPAAAVELLQRIMQLWDRMTAYFRQRKFNEKEAQVVRELYQTICDAMLCLGDCAAMLGKDPTKAYRYSYDAALDYGNPDYVRQTIISHAMGDYGDVYPRPLCLAAATELALAMAGEGSPMGGHFLMALVEVRKLDYASLGRSWEQNAAIYSKGDGAYSLYQIGRAKLYGLGLPQDTAGALEMLKEAYNNQSVQAAHLLFEYYSHAEMVFERTNPAAAKEAGREATEWSRRYERLRKDPAALTKIQSTGAVSREMADLARQHAAPEPAEPEEDAAEAAEPAAPGQAPAVSDHDLSRMPAIVYDDSNRQWKKRGMFGDHVVYDSDDGGEVTIYSGQISGTTATTSAGTFHWY